MPRTLMALACTIMVSFLCAAANAQTIQSTPVPTPSKPDMSSMQYLVGTWNCSVKSARRPGPYTVTTTYTMDPGGYWILGKTVVHPTSWIPNELTSQDRMTYDASTSQWVDITSDDLGGYDVSTSPGWKGNTIVWHDAIYPKTNNTATNGDTTETKQSDSKTSSMMSFTEPSGRSVAVTTVCTKS